MYFQPRVVYRNPNDSKENSIVRYIGNRVLRNNKNFLCALTGQTGAGKSWAGNTIGEIYSTMYDIEFNPDIHVLFNLKQLLKLITSKEVNNQIRFGSFILFDEPQIEANARDWQGEMNKILSQLVSTFRNQRLVVFFALPELSMLDKQSRILFHGEFRVLGYDKNTGITTIKPRFLEYNKNKEDFYRKRLIVEYAAEGKTGHNVQKLNKWHIPKPSQNTIDIYEAKKKRFTDELNQRLLNNIELKEKAQEGKNKAEDLLKIKDLYLQYGDDYIEICKKMPHISPMSIEKLVLLVKRSIKREALRMATT